MEALVISHVSALRGLRAERRKYAAIRWQPVGRVEARQALASCVPRDATLDLTHLERLGFWGNLPTENLDVMVADPAARGRSRVIRYHVATRPLPSNALLKIEPGLYCVSPAFAAYQYGHGRSMPAAFTLFMELMGTYSLPEEATMPIAWGGTWPDEASLDDAQQVHYGCEPAVTASQLKAMSVWSKSSAYHNCRIAQKLAISGSASPAETIQFGLFGLPMRFGGLGIQSLPGGMQLNRRIDFDATATLMASGITYAVADAFIPAANTDIEYNGIGHEAMPYRMHDGQRNNGLRGMGVRVLVINRDQLCDLAALEAIAKTVYREAGVRYRCRITQFRLLQQCLLNELRAAAGMRRA